MFIKYLTKYPPRSKCSINRGYDSAVFSNGVTERALDSYSSSAPWDSVHMMTNNAGLVCLPRVPEEITIAVEIPIHVPVTLELGA